MDDTHALITTLKEIFQTAFISFGIFLFVYIFLVQPHRVQGISMHPNFDNGELLLTEKVSYKFSDPKRSDVIVFQAPIEKKADFIKRIIGTPGDTIKIHEGGVYINSVKLDENYILGTVEGDKTITLGENDYFVMGDNRTASSDSRVFGSIKKNAIRGKVWVVYWPFIKSGNFKGARFVSDVYNAIPNRFKYFGSLFYSSFNNN
ncbi:signal peptidase I [Candidatus Curtissbacteria bacterium RIFCSPLOWO2_01_FULL_38_11b]|uniref:Signal peptidase I n=1 Tax=Candidatus Curtissbacteria bacterium RIFCSPLOWO2_01_FULL_38_11b TaxID=1797725 RepID=A0A1F5GZC4_9BACT|nr:MAG: signal peptidase I [Candidatus Curtissbacteria bacterium RIFCSPLOWO2_01_FULL_38_11b]